MQGEEYIFSKKEFEMIRVLVESIIETLNQPIAVLNSILRILTANNPFYSTFKTDPSETIDKLFYELGNRQWDIPELHSLLDKIITERITIEKFVVSHNFPHIGKKIMSIRAKSIQTLEPEFNFILLTI